MLRKAVLGIVLTLLLTSMSSSAFIIQPVKAEPGTIYIRADGSVDPLTAPIQRDGDVYTFTGNIYDSIVVERNNIAIDGNGYTLQGDGTVRGFFLESINNVTIRKTNIKGFTMGIQLYDSSYNTISRNNVTNNKFGITLSLSQNNTVSQNNIITGQYGIRLLEYTYLNTISQNNITTNEYGIYLCSPSNHNLISRNHITNNYWGIYLYGFRSYWSSPYSFYTTVSENNITNNTYGIMTYWCKNSFIYHNNFINNVRQIIGYAEPGYVLINVWDDGYPSGGNYWSDYTDADLYSGPYQNETGGDGIWDHPYVIDENNQDRYPLENPWTPTPPWPMPYHDAYHTGRSEYIGPLTNKVAWVYDFGNITYPSVGSWQPIVGPNGIIYFGLGSGDSGKLYAINPDGTARWSFDLESVPGTPAVGLDGTIYLGSSNGVVYAINPDGTEKFRFQHDEATFFRGITRGLTIGPDGTLYFSSGTRVYAYRSDGSKKWSFEYAGYKPHYFLLPAIGQDGSIYVVYPGFRTLTDEASGFLHALKPDGTLKWSRRLSVNMGPPSIGVDGTIYVNGEYLYAINPDGSIIWSQFFTPEPQAAKIAIGPDGIIIASGKKSTLRPVLKVLTSDGDVLWTFDSFDELFAITDNILPPVLDAKGNIFFLSYVDIGKPQLVCRLYALDKTGSMKWSYDFNESWWFRSTLSVGADGFLYVDVYKISDWPPKGELNVLYAFGPGPTKENQPPVASFTYNPPNPIIDEDITFDASASYDPDGGTITNYRWEFYRLTDAGAIVLPPIEIIEGEDKEVVSYSLGKGSYLITLTVTDDEGETSRTSKTVKVWEKWSFAIIADPQIGIHLANEDEDYGDPGWDDDESGDEYYVTDYLNKAVHLINRHIELGNEYNIAFVVVLGDMSDSAEMSEFNMVVGILNKLDVPWIPIIGNHDIWPYSSSTNRYSGSTPDSYFYDIIKSQYEYLSNFFENWTKQEPLPIEDPGGTKYYYFQNFAFDYKGYHFIGLDFNSRNLVFPPPLVPPHPSWAGVKAWAYLYDFEGGTWDWFKEHFDAYADKGNENTIIFSHHPMRWDPLPRAFSLSDMAKISWYINTNNFRDNIWGNFAGHTHKNREGYVEATGMYCIETVATFKDPHPRIVQVYADETIDYSTLLRDEQKSMRITAHSPVDLAVTDPDELTVSKELNEIPGAFYLEDDVNEDGLPDDFIVIPERKIGDYLITVLPEPDAEPTDTYTLEVSGEDATIVLAENVQISDIPAQPYVLNSAALDIPPTTLLDIREPLFVIDDTTYLTSVTSIALIANDNPGGSGVASTIYRIYNATYDSDWLLYTQPFYPTGLNDGAYSIDYNSTDNVGNIELTNTVTIILDNTAPSTFLTVGEPMYQTDITYVTLETPFTLEANDNTGSGVYFIAYKVYNSSYDSGWLPYTAPFRLATLADGIYTIEFNSTDNVSNVEPSNIATVVLDNTGPSVAVLNPPVGWALQDGVTFIISAIDIGSGVSSVDFSIREANGGEGTPVGFEDLPASYNATTGKWTIFFDTLQLPDGYYIVIVKAKDNLGHTGSTIVPYSIRNWAVIELLPASETNKAGRTMPVKFALRVAASVDPNQPFVYNEDLIIRIYDVNDPGNILQTSTFGDTARDYRINALNELYITNFKTLKTQTTYIVEIYRKDMLIDTFDFSTQ